MAILNVTPDSFYAASRISNTDELVRRAQQALSDGASILDIGGCSTRPNSIPATEEEEWQRLEPALGVLREALPDARLSLDTFRPEIAQKAVEKFGPMIINDISGGSDDMFAVVRAYHLPYVWTFCGDYEHLEARMHQLSDINLILDPGFGFIGSVDKDYECLRQMDCLQKYGHEILVGVSRKSMIWKLLSITPEESLAATQVLHLQALIYGATILRVHDVRAASHTIELFKKIKQDT
ncbi:MAG: dihydropteroate synthase [Paludibacteraceae bacterium]|nr:dihydropteroate synthase [Paludibacteraceae bacterium]